MIRKLVIKADCNIIQSLSLRQERLSLNADCLIFMDFTSFKSKLLNVFLNFFCHSVK